MPVHFKPAEPPARAVRRICREHIGEALARLRRSRHPAAVHGARKEIKKLRAVLRLVCGEIGRGVYRPAAKALRRATGHLAATRDARVMFQAFAKLAGPGAARRFPILHQALQKHCRLETRRFRNDDAVAVAKRLLRKTGRRVAGLKIKASGWRALEPGLKQSYRRGQQASELARRQSSAENFHAWRKQVKTLWHQLRLLCPKRPARTLTDKLDRLGELLGDHHDLALLQQFVAKQGQPVEATALNLLIEARQLKLRGAALKLGTQLYAKAPATVCQRLGKNWSNWHGRHRK
jgi:CHAD domain-containing protein